MALLLDHLGRTEDAARIEAAVDADIAERGATKRPTSVVGHEIAARLLPLRCTNRQIRALRDGCVAQRVRWADLVEVGVMTTDEGPLGEDFWLILIGADAKGCAVPSELPGFAELRDRVFKLPAFDFERWIEACGSTENAKFVCWKRP